jgi:hypothetical protein
VSDDKVQEFAENLIDDLRIAEEVAERDAADTGERLTLEELEATLDSEQQP